MKKFVLSLFLVFSFIGFARADELSESLQEISFKDNDNSLILGIPEVMSLAGDQNLDIAISKSREKQAQSYFFGSFANIAPSIRAQGSVEKFQGGEIFFGPIPVQLDRTTYKPSLSADYQINTGGRAIFQIMASKYSYDRSKAVALNVSQGVLHDALTGYFIWLRDNSKMEVAKQSLKEAETQLQTIEARQKAGFATSLDTNQSLTTKYERENLLLEADSQRKVSGVNLSVILNIPVEKTLIPADKLLKPIDFWTEELDLPAILEIASENRIDLKALTSSIKEARARFGSSIADLFPTISLSGYTRGIGPNLNELDRSKQGSISINIDLLRNLGIDTAANIRVNKARIEEAILNKEKQLIEMRKEIAQAYYDMHLSQDKLKVATAQLKSTQEAHRISISRQKAGLGINLEIVHAQTKLTEARLEYQDAALKYNNSQIKLLYETGQLTVKKILDHAGII